MKRECHQQVLPVGARGSRVSHCAGESWWPGATHPSGASHMSHGVGDVELSAVDMGDWVPSLQGLTEGALGINEQGSSETP
jgi:hypothetical protein